MNVQFQRTALAAGFLCMLLVGRLGAEDGTNDAVYSEAQAAVVDIVAAEGHGTGILLSDSGRILTNAHFAASGQPLQCRIDVRVAGKLQTATFKRVTVVGYHPSLDLAVLQIDPHESNGALQPAKLARRRVAAGQRAELILNAESGGSESTKTLTPVDVDEIIRFPDIDQCYRIKGPGINAGSTGGPLCDDTGKMLAIVVVRAVDQQLAAVGLPLDEVTKSLGKLVPFNKRKPDAQTAKVLVQLGDNDAALAQQIAMARGMADSDARLHFAAAANDYRQAVAEDPTEAKYFYYFGGVLRMMEKFEAAVPYLMQAIAMDPWVHDEADYYRELDVALLQSPNKQAEGRIVCEEGLEKFPRLTSKIWEDLAIGAATDKQPYDAAYFAAAALHITNQRTRTDVLREIYRVHRGMLADVAQRQLEQAEGKLDDMLRQRQETSDRVRKAGQRFINRPCEELIAKGTRGLFHSSAGGAAASIASSTDDHPAANPPEAHPADEPPPPADDPDDPARVRSPVPTAEKLAEALKDVKEVYGAETAAATTTDAKKALAKKLLTTAREADEKDKDMSARFALLRMARDYATQIGDVETAFAAVDETIKSFEVDALELRSGALTKLAAVARTRDQHKALAAKGLALLHAALAKDNLAIAKQIAATVRSEAVKGTDKAATDEVAELAAEIDSIAKSHEALKSALETLKKDANDPEANLAVGKYHCFIKGDWKTGLPMLALSGDAALKDAAEKDLAGADSTDAQVALGDLWWDLAEKQEGIAKRRARQRAAYWYDQALPELSGLTKQKIELRVKRASADP